MREQQAKDFWSAYLKLILRKGQETTIVNPFEEFRDSVAKGGYSGTAYVWCNVGIVQGFPLI